MSLAERFRAFLHPNHAENVALRGLEERIAQLESREVAHDIAWTEAKEQISRHLKRVAEVERRAKAREENGRLEMDDLDRIIIAAKLRGGS